MSVDSIKREVRQRDRFICPNCNERKGEQYAHIIPDSMNGSYDLDNLLFLCTSCHNQLEPARTKSATRNRYLKLAYKLRDRPRQDGVLESVFTIAGGEFPTILLGGGIKILNTVSILEKKGDPSNPYLKLTAGDCGLIINARFEDAAGKPILGIVDNKLSVHTKDVWDIIFLRRKIAFEDASKEIALSITEEEDGALLVMGRLFLNGGLFEIDKSGIKDVTTGNFYANSGSLFNGYGARLEPGGLIL